MSLLEIILDDVSIIINSDTQLQECNIICQSN